MLLRKGVYFYEVLDDWEKFNEKSLPDDLKKSIKLYISTDIDMLSMVEKGIRGGIHRAIHRYGKANNKYMKDYDKNKEWLGNVAKASSKKL